MIFYYRNPRTEDLIIVDSNEDEVLVLEKIKTVKVFTTRELSSPQKEDPIEKITQVPLREEPSMRGVKRSPKKWGKIPPEVRIRVRQLSSEGISGAEIAKQVGISPSGVYKIINEKKDVS